MLVPSTRTQLGRQSFHVAAPAVWNVFPPQLRSSSISRGQFRAELKTHLFTQAYTDTSENFCRRAYYFTFACKWRITDRQCRQFLSVCWCVVSWDCRCSVSAAERPRRRGAVQSAGSRCWTHRAGRLTEVLAARRFAYGRDSSRRATTTSACRRRRRRRRRCCDRRTWPSPSSRCRRDRRLHRRRKHVAAGSVLRCHRKSPPSESVICVIHLLMLLLWLSTSLTASRDNEDQQ